MDLLMVKVNSDLAYHCGNDPSSIIMGDLWCCGQLCTIASSQISSFADI